MKLRPAPAFACIGALIALAALRSPAAQLDLAGKDHLTQITRFDMPNFRPLPMYTRELKRFGILPKDLPETTPIDPYATDQAYWRSLWWAPELSAKQGDAAREKRSAEGVGGVR